MSCFDLIQEIESSAKGLTVSVDLNFLKIMLLIGASSKHQISSGVLVKAIKFFINSQGCCDRNSLLTLTISLWQYRLCLRLK